MSRVQGHKTPITLNTQFYNSTYLRLIYDVEIKLLGESRKECHGDGSTKYNLLTERNPRFPLLDEDLKSDRKTLLSI